MSFLQIIDILLELVGIVCVGLGLIVGISILVFVFVLMVALT